VKVDRQIPEYGEIPSERAAVHSEADYYGASHIIATLLGRKKPYISRSAWLHGWQSAEWVRFPEELNLSCRSVSDRVLVHTATQAKLLQSSGYQDTHAVGMPFAYVWKYFLPPERISNSLLIMPPHSTLSEKRVCDEQGYIDSLKESLKSFERVAACVTRGCIENGLWQKNLEKAGIEVIIGGDVHDRNSLLRSFALFSTFEVVTTPDPAASQLVYASLCGARVSLFGSDRFWASFLPKDMNNPFFTQNPRVADYRSSGEAIKKVRSASERFISSPDQATTHLDWAQKEAGVEHIVSPQQMEKYLNWSSIDPFQDLIRRIALRSSAWWSLR